MITEQNITYIPPAAAVFDKLAREACRVLAEQNEYAFNDPEVMQGLADYLQLVAELTAKYLNKGHYELLDKHEG